MLMRKTSQKGMTLIELSIALVLFSLLILPVFIMQNKQVESEKRSKTVAQLSSLDTALERFVITHGRYPLPARRDLSLDNAEAGREYAAELDDLKECAGNTAEVCTLSSMTEIDDGDPDTDDRQFADVLRGDFPYATLGLPVTATLDGYGNKMVYFVTKDLTDDVKYTNDGGRLQIRNKANPDEILLTGNSVHFALMSAGPNGVGAYTLDGVLRLTCEGGAGDADDEEGGEDEEEAGPEEWGGNGPGEAGINCSHPVEDGKALARLFQNVGQTNTGSGVFRDVLMSYGTQVFDDYLQFTNSDTTQLWTRKTDSNDILSKTTGNIRIGQERLYANKTPEGYVPIGDQPAAKIEVMGNVSASILDAPRLCPMEAQIVDGEDVLCDDRKIEDDGKIPQNFFTSALLTKNFDPLTAGGEEGQGIHCQSSKTTGTQEWATKGFTGVGKVDEKCDLDKADNALKNKACATNEWAYGYDGTKILCTSKSLYGKLESSSADKYVCTGCTTNGGGGASGGGSAGAGNTKK